MSATLSARIRAASWDAHEKAERSAFMADLLEGKLERREFARLAAQQYFVYDVLEDASVKMADDPIAGRFVFRELFRVPSLADDLAFLLGDDWRARIEPTPATRAYCDRLKAVCYTWPAGFVAHHYVRYLGDLSGGQVIRRIVKGIYGLDDHQGTSFYAFDAIPDAKDFKAGYRQRLDGAPWDVEEQQRMTEEILRAYRFNIAVLEDLAKQ